MMKSMAPEALNIPMATSMATRKGIILTATPNPSLAPSINASYTFTFFNIASTMNRIIMVKRMKFAAKVDTSAIFSLGSELK